MSGDGPTTDGPATDPTGGPTDGPPPGGFADPGANKESAHGPSMDSAGDPFYGLRNSEPPISPSEIGHQLDLNAAWWQHYGCGFVKQSNSDGIEAWQHYLMGTAILLLTLTNGLNREDSGGSETDESGGVPAAVDGVDP
jgi:hypothetical protein